MPMNLQALVTQYKLPPNRANLKLKGQLTTTAAVRAGLFQAGLRAEDLQPIDWRKKAQLSPIQNQGSCGNCWSQSSCSCMADKFAIHKNIPGLRLDQIVVAQCTPDVYDRGCGGGYPVSAFQFMESNGLPEVEKGCTPWENVCSDANCTLPSCQSIIQTCKSATTYKAKKGSTRNIAASTEGGNIDPAVTIINIKKELLNGPVVCAFFVPKDFMASAVYKNWPKTNGVFINGAYEKELQSLPDNFKNAMGNPQNWGDIIVEGGSPAGHAMSIVGWDKENVDGYGTVEYWIIRNSWGNGWGDGGYCKFAISGQGKGINQYLGVDVPVTSLTIASQGSSTPLGGVFGGCCTADPDLSTGKEGGGGGSPGPSPGPGPSPSPSSSSDDKSNTALIISLVILGVIIVGGGFVLYKGVSKKRRQK